MIKAQCLSLEPLSAPFKYLDRKPFLFYPSLDPPGFLEIFSIGFDLCINNLGGSVVSITP